MKWWQALVLGLTQGLTEFLPVSSSGHLTLLQRVFGIDVGGAALFFDIILHIGTLVAVCFIFRRDILNLFKKPFGGLIYLAAATLPAAIVGVLFDGFIEETVLGGKYAGIYLSVFFLITAVTLFVTELYAKRRKTALPLRLNTALCMGAAQAVAVLPGISRSGFTIAAGTLAGGSAEDVSRFSFLMSVPVILGGFAVTLIKGLMDGQGGFAYSFQVAGAQFGWCIAIGFIASALSGLFAVKVMLAAIKRADYKWFSLYLVLLSAACLSLYFTGVI